MPEQELCEAAAGVGIDVTVLMTTRNRAGVLRQTLEAMTCLRSEGLSVKFVVVDNGSSDDTPAVLERFARRLPLRALHHALPGKARALNYALESVRLGSIVVFTDDDITPQEDWLEAIVAACQRWPDRYVFGGVIQPEWPNGRRCPDWAKQDVIQSLAFARHDCGGEEVNYPEDKDPFGGNYWVRRSVLVGRRFQVRIGAHPTRQRLGDETQFIRQLRRLGHTPVYVPAARVKHRISPESLTKTSVYHRAWQGGLGLVYVHGIPRKELYWRSRVLWGLRCLSILTKIAFEFPLVACSRDEKFRVLNTTYLVWSVAEHLQALRLIMSADPDLMQWITSAPQSGEKAPTQGLSEPQY